jgi:hypothetical protein
MQNAYKKQISVLLKKMLVSRAKARYHDMRPLLEALGCRMTHTSGAFLAPSASDEVLVKDALLQVLRSGSGMGISYGDSFSILDGLAQNDRWRDLLHSQESARSLVDAILVVPQFQFEFRNTDPSTPAVIIALTILNGWLQPLVSFTSVPSYEALVRAFFGDAWCNIVADGLNMDPGPLRRLIASDAPPLLDSLLLGVAVEPLPLPALS